MQLTPRQRWERGFAAMGPDVAWKNTAVEMGLSDGSADSMKELNTRIGTIYPFVWNDKTWVKRPYEELDLPQIAREAKLPLSLVVRTTDLMVRHDMIKRNESQQFSK